MNDIGKKVVAKVAAIVAVSGAVFALPATSATVSPISAIALAEPQASPLGCGPQSLDHCYTEPTMRSYFDKTLPMIVQFFKVKYKAMPGPSNYYFIAKGQPKWRKCLNKEDGSHFASDKTYSYCPNDYSVYLGQERMWSLYDKDGDIAPAVGLAHELGHHIQTQKGVQKPKSHDEWVNHEKQADCVAGAWIQYADQQKWLKPEDGRSIDNMLADIADAEDIDGDHGTPRERGNAMSLGFKGGLEACNEFYPETHIITDRD